MKTVYMQVIRDGNDGTLRVWFRGKDLPAGLQVFGRNVSNGVIVDGPQGERMPARVACDWLRDEGIENIVNDGCSGKGISHD